LSSSFLLVFALFVLVEPLYKQHFRTTTTPTTNTRLGTLVCEFEQYSPVLCLSFRSDSHCLLASGLGNGQIALWDLEHKKLRSLLDAHGRGLTSVHFLEGEPVLVSASEDNSLKMWIFDAADGSGRLLRERSGHR